jgi:hypothetical protein
VGGTYLHFCEGLQTAWFAAGLQQIFFHYDSELYGYYHDHEQPGDVVPAAVRSYFSDENPSACSIM